MGYPPIPIPNTLNGVDDLVRFGLETYSESWFNWLLVATALVVIGLLFEAPEIWHETVRAIGETLRPSESEVHVPRWMKLAGTVGWVLIVVGVGGEFVAESFVSKADELVRKFDEIVLAEAQRGTSDARERAAAAYASAAQTEREASQENERAAKSLEASELARKEAEGFSLQIAEANERSAKANERAAQLEQRATAAELELARIKTPRSLTRIPELIATLKPFKGTEYSFSFVFQDEDSINLLKAIDDVLQRAEWKRAKPPHGFPGLEFWGKRGDSVRIGFGTGLIISTESPESLTVLESKPLTDLPQYMRAGIALNVALASSISPPQGPADTKLIDIEKGNTETLLIGVGKKP